MQDQPQPVAFPLLEELTASEETQSLVVFHRSLGDVPVLGDVRPTEARAATESISFPFHNSRDTLRALHIMRC
jgi:hypothetical protein